MFRTIVADDSEEFRNWFRQILEQSSDFQIIGETSSGQETLDLCLGLLPDLLIMDVFMPDFEGTYVSAQLRTEAPSIKTVLISANTGQVYEGLAQNHGAIGFISKMSLTVETLQAGIDPTENRERFSA